MGSEVIAKCKCGFEATILIGGSRANFQTVQHFPVLCNCCSSVVQVDAISDRPEHTECGSYDVTHYNDESLIGTLGDRTTAQSFDLVLSDGAYKCSGYGECSLQFFSTDLSFD